MKKKIYQRLSILFLILGISAIVYPLSLTGIFNKNKLIVRALACESCANYEVISGSFKLSGQVPDTLNTTQVFLTGLANPYGADFTKTYDHYLVTGKVTGIKQIKGSGTWSPVFTVSAWEHIYLGYAWPVIFLIIILSIVSFRFRRKYKDANHISALESSIRGDSGTPGY
jgi:hypothetical protein